MKSLTYKLEDLHCVDVSHDPSVKLSHCVNFLLLIHLDTSVSILHYAAVKKSKTRSSRNVALCRTNEYTNQLDQIKYILIIKGKRSKILITP